MAGSAPYYDGVLEPAAGGIRVPTEVYGTKKGVPGGTFALRRESAIDVAAVVTSRGPSPIALTPGETNTSFFSFTDAGAACIFELPAVIPGAVYALLNHSGQNITLRVKGQTGVLLATAHSQIVGCSTLAGDVVPLSAAQAA